MSSHQSPPKRPRLSLQIKAMSSGPSIRSSRTLAAVVNPTSPTAFNTLSNVYSTAIDRSTPIQSEPVTAIDTRSAPPLLRLRTQDAPKDTPAATPYTAYMPDTPLTAQPMSPAVAMEINFPSTMTATPPLSAGPEEQPRLTQFPFAFPAQDGKGRLPSHLPAPSPITQRRRLALDMLPYNHTRSLHSILRNSPLPPRTAQTPISPRRQSLRLQEKAARRVGYNSPLTQTIITNKYTKSHIDLLFDEVSPYSPANPAENLTDVALDLTMAYTGDETRDGGQTPGPFEEMRRRMAGLVTETPVSAGPSLLSAGGHSAGGHSAGGIRKRKRKDKRRRWVWTIGQEDDDENLSGAMVAIKAAESVSRQSPSLMLGPPEQPAKRPAISVNTMVAIPELSVPEIITPSIESSDMSQDSVFDEGRDVDMSDTCSVVSDLTDRALTPADMDLDMVTPTVTRKLGNTPNRRRLGSSRLGSERLGSERLGSEDLINPETGSRRDTPIPADLVC